MAALWPWLALAGLGVLHGLNPATGWGLAVARGSRARGGAAAWRTLVPLGAGHAASVAVVAAALAQGFPLEPAWVTAGVLFAGAALWHFRRGAGCGGALARHAGNAGIALWSFLMATLHGAGMMLVPALVPLCLSDNPAREITASGSPALALAAVAVHMAAMLLTTGLVAAGTIAAARRLSRLRKGGGVGRRPAA